MKKHKKTIMVTVLMLLVLLGGFVAIEKTTDIFTRLDLLIFALIIILGVVAMVNAIKRDRDKREGIPVEDEMSTQIKYKAGYFAFLASMYMWLFIFLFKDKFPDVESILGGGILLSAALSVIIKFIIKRQFNEQ